MPKKDDDDAWMKQVMLRQLIRETLNAKQHQLLELSEIARKVATNADEAWDDACDAIREFDRMKAVVDGKYDG